MSLDDWFGHYERVRTYNDWDNTAILANIVIFLKETALNWLDNHEEEIIF